MIRSMVLTACLSLAFPGAGMLAETMERPAAICSEWELDRSSGGVKTYMRWVAEEGSPRVRERKGVMLANCTVNDAVKAVCDPGITGQWMSGIQENYRLKQVDRTEWYAYTLFDIPWPFEKRDLVSNYKLEQSRDASKVTITINSREDYIPGRENVTRLTDYSAAWVITRISEDQVSLSFSAVANTPPVFSRYIQDPVLARMFHNNLVNLKKMLEG